MQKRTYIKLTETLENQARNNRIMRGLMMEYIDSGCQDARILQEIYQVLLSGNSDCEMLRSCIRRIFDEDFRDKTIPMTYGENR